MNWLVGEICKFIRFVFKGASTDEDYEFHKWFYDHLKEDN